MLHCDFCGCCSTNRGKGWVARLADDHDAIDGPVVAVYCPPCANTVFGYRPDVAAEYVCFWEPLPADPPRRLEEL